MKKNLPHLVSIVAAVFLSMNAFTQDIPDTLTTGYGDGGDTYLGNDERKLPDENSGDAEYLVVRNHEVRMRIILLKFDITDNPRFSPANQAYIGLYVNHAEKMTETFREISVYGMTDDTWDNWDEYSVTYNTAPGLAPADLANYSLIEEKTKYLTMLTVPADTLGWVYSEPTTEMDEFINDINTNGILTFILLVEVPSEGDEVRFDSKEYTAASDTMRSPILHTMEPIGIGESKTLSGVNLEQNFPNPFVGTTTLTYHLMEAEQVEITLYNMLGAKVATIVNESQVSGVHHVHVDADRLNLSSGIYYADFRAGLYRQTMKLIVSE